MSVVHENLITCSSKRDLVSKILFYKNVNEISSVDSLILGFSELKNKSLVILGLSFFYLLTQKKGYSKIKQKKIFSKNFNCSVKLKSFEIFLFLEKFFYFNLPNILDLEGGFSKKFCSDSGTFSFSVKDIYAFSELGDSLVKFQSLKNLNIVLNFSSMSKKENIFLLQSLGFIFKK